MRLVRLGALVGSVVLLVATSVSMFNKRVELQRELDAQVASVVLLVNQSADATVARALAVAEASTVDTDPSALTASFGADAAACIATASATDCNGADLLALGAFGAAARASLDSGGSAVVAVDESSDSILIVARDDFTVVIKLQSQELLGEITADAFAETGAAVDVALAADRQGASGVAELRNVDGYRVLESVTTLPGDGGTIVIGVRLANNIGLVGEGLMLYLVLLALGTVLVGLAGWTFRIDRRALEIRATTDELTGLVNRHEFERRTDEALIAAERSGVGLCIMLIDLNGFKQINDTLGHQFGDLVLQASAERLSGAVRETEIVGRWGGDEFVVLLPGVEGGSAVRSSAERIAHRLSTTPIVGDVSIAAAVGAAVFPQHGKTLDELIKAADLAMYGAKSTGVSYRVADSLAHDMAAEGQLFIHG